RRRLLIGADAKAVDVIQRILPQGYQKIFAAATAWQTRLLNKSAK
ncbi:short-chain dehydrogenase, partial [Acinetobacter baumannii]